ncbi:hypothetical protein [Streptomyces pinistramenti]|uniref:hypothetical protein n=1 Tax=Streptomyces pinistramenti TaxID=2884812 RepID=UPI001D089347|nr:hypothetical protein [Streptomyces pinistramenti]MCB5912117.1 hypothetical protein [Streptomyces pinistramenti]
MTITVYRVDPDTRRRTDVSALTVPQATAPPQLPQVSMAFPPCRCVRCGDQGALPPLQPPAGPHRAAPPALP